VEVGIDHAHAKAEPRVVADPDRLLGVQHGAVQQCIAPDLDARARKNGDAVRAVLAAQPHACTEHERR